MSNFLDGPEDEDETADMCWDKYLYTYEHDEYDDDWGYDYYEG